MTHDNFTTVGNEKTAIIPIVTSELFANTDCTYFIGVVATSGEVKLADEYVGAGVLRANVYIDEKKFLHPSARQVDGTETDNDDVRSRHYVALERVDKRHARVIGNMRTIIKGRLSEDDFLPAERFFPGAFPYNGAPVHSIEASRFIARHENPRVQKDVYMSLIRTVILDALDQGNKPIYAVVEKELKQNLEKSGMPFTELHETVEIEEYDYTMNMLLRFDPRTVKVVARGDDRRSLAITPFFNVAGKNNGMGYYKDSLLTPGAAIT